MKLKSNSLRLVIGKVLQIPLFRNSVPSVLCMLSFWFYMFKGEIYIWMTVIERNPENMICQNFKYGFVSAWLLVHIVDVIVKTVWKMLSVSLKYFEIMDVSNFDIPINVSDNLYRKLGSIAAKVSLG